MSFELSEYARQLQERNAKFRALLEKIDLPSTHLHVCGNIITVTCRGKETAHRWQMVLLKFMRRVTIDEGYQHNKKNEGTCLRPSAHVVYKVGGMIV